MKSIIIKKIKKLKGKKAYSLIEAAQVPKNIEENIDKNSSRFDVRNANSNPSNSSKKQLLYKYMALDTTLKCLSTKTIRFSQPTNWQDKWEERFYLADYSNVTKNPQEDTPRFYACCFSTNKDSEAAWNTYRYGKQGAGNCCVKFKLRKKALRQSIVANNNVVNSYEGFINYSLTDYEILNLHHVGRPFHKEVFNSGHFCLNHYLSLMLLKRKAFYYEGEYRFMISTKANNDNLFIDIGIDWASIIEDIEVDKDCNTSKLVQLKDCLQGIGVKKEIIENIRSANLYEDNSGRITIEK